MAHQFRDFLTKMMKVSIIKFSLPHDHNFFFQLCVHVDILNILSIFENIRFLLHLIEKTVILIAGAQRTTQVQHKSVPGHQTHTVQFWVCSGLLVQQHSCDKQQSLQQPDRPHRRKEILPRRNRQIIYKPLLCRESEK